MDSHRTHGYCWYSPDDVYRPPTTAYTGCVGFVTRGLTVEMIMNTKMESKVVASAVKVSGNTPLRLPLMNWLMTERETSIHESAAAKKKPCVNAVRD